MNCFDQRIVDSSFPFNIVHINDIYNRINGLSNSGQESGWTGKKIVWLGTSIPYGQGTDGVASAPTTYPMQIGDNLIHNRIDLLVVKRLVLILENKRNGV